MINTELRLHGQIDDSIEYFATAAGGQTLRAQFYQQNGETLRFFAPGNEFTLTDEGITHSGNGGSFCAYMFGVEQPLADLAKQEIHNRLILYGTSYNDENQLTFSDKTEGRQTYERIFLEGHAVYNTFFFLQGINTHELKEQQRIILQILGKGIKRVQHLNAMDDAQMATELLHNCPANTSLYLIRLIHKKHRVYQQLFRERYFANRNLDLQNNNELDALAKSLKIDRYQRERIQIDIMYGHRDNYRIVDEYKKVLISCHQQGQINEAANARLTRLKTLSVRQNIPAALFIALDELLKTDEMETPQEASYIADTRQILQGLMLHGEHFESSIDQRDMVSLLVAKQQATKNRDHTFEHLLLETGKLCDEKIRDGADLSLLEHFSYIVTFFDRFDSSSQHINQLAFMDGYQLSEEVVRSLLGSREAFENLQPGLFDSLFFDAIEGDSYLGRFGRRKIKLLRRSLEKIAHDQFSVGELLADLAQLNDEEHLYLLLLNQAKQKISTSYSRYYTRKEQEDLLNEISRDLNDKQILTRRIPATLFDDVVMHIKKEAVYLHNLLPQIIQDKDRKLRDDFLLNSGLDRFTIEEIEREYFSRHDLDQSTLLHLRAS